MRGGKRIPKLYWKYGTMNSSKTAQVLMTKFNYEEKGYRVALVKPSIDNRDGANVIKSRIGLQAECITVDREYCFLPYNFRSYDVIIVDEAQFLTARQVLELKMIAITYIPIICFGLKTDFQMHLFEGSKRLFELADSISEIKSICKCGNKAEVNARIIDGNVVYSGEQVLIGGNDKYEAMCFKCWSNYNQNNFEKGIDKSRSM